MNNGHRIVALMDELRAMPQYELLMSLRGFNVSIFTFDWNFTDLSKLIEFITTDPKASHLHAMRNRDKLHEFLSQIIRTLHNFVAAAQSLIDHTRRLHRNLYAETGEFQDYQARIEEEFARDPMSQFVIGLRQYCQHYKAPNLAIETTWERGDDNETRTVYLLKEDLLAFGRWNALALEFLDAIEEKVNLLEITSTYRQKVLDFYEWFQARQFEIHATEMAEFRDRENELHILMLEQQIHSGLHNRGVEMPHERDGIFLSIFTSDEFAQLDTLPTDSLERPQKAIELLQQHLPVSEELGELIYRWYREIGSQL